jgi:general secretion pathway protein E
MIEPSEAAVLGVSENTEVYRPVGCARCGHTGYMGRFAVYEYFIFSEEDRRNIALRPESFSAEARRGKAPGILSNGLRNLRDGNTSADEIIRVR